MATDVPEDWNARGRFNYRGETSRSGQFDWQQRGDAFEVRLFGTFGLGAVKIVGDSGRISIESGGETYYTETPDFTLFQLTGIDMPITELTQWMTGGTGNAGEWSVLQEDYRHQDRFVLPHRLELSRPSVLLRIAILAWETSIDS